MYVVYTVQCVQAAWPYLGIFLAMYMYMYVIGSSLYHDHPYILWLYKLHALYCWGPTAVPMFDHVLSQL